MRIKANKTFLSNKLGLHVRAGQIYVVDDKYGADLIRNGLASVVEGAAPREQPKPKPKPAALKRAPERAATDGAPETNRAPSSAAGVVPPSSASPAARRSTRKTSKPSADGGTGRGRRKTAK